MRSLPFAYCIAALALSVPANGQDLSKKGILQGTPKYLLVPLDENGKVLNPAPSSMPGHYAIAPGEFGQNITSAPDVRIVCNDSEKKNLSERVKALEQLNAALETKLKLLEITLAQRDAHK